MSILNAILGAQDGQTVGALSQQFGLSSGSDRLGARRAPSGARRRVGAVSRTREAWSS